MAMFFQMGAVHVSNKSFHSKMGVHLCSDLMHVPFHLIAGLARDLLHRFLYACVRQCRRFPTFDEEYLQACHPYLDNHTVYYLVHLCGDALG